MLLKITCRGRQGYTCPSAFYLSEVRGGIFMLLLTRMHIYIFQKTHGACHILRVTSCAIGSRPKNFL